MALEISNQYLYTGRGPFDAKSLVKTYAELLLEETWLSDAGKSTAYNGMIVSVWLDTTKNGIYYLHDSLITNTFKAPDVTKEKNWHKIAEGSELADFVTSDSIKEIKLLNDQTILDVAQQVVTNTDNIAILNNNISGIQATLENIGSASTDTTAATGLYLSVEQITTSVDDINAKLVGIDNNTTVLQVIEATVEEAVKNISAAELTVATEEYLGGIKSGSGENIVSVDYDTGIASVSSVNVNSLVQNDGDVLILSGGGCLTQE